MARKSREEAEKTRERIIAAAEKVFASQGYARAALSDIARAAQVPKSLIHHHFGEKQRLWDVVHLASLTRYAAEQLAALSSDPSGQQFVRRTFTTYFRFLQENPAFLQMAYWSQAERGISFARHDSATLAVARNLVEQGAGRLRELQKAGELRGDVEPEMLIACFLSLLRQWFAVRHDYFNETTDPRALDDEYLHTAITLFWEGVKPRLASTETS